MSERHVAHYRILEKLSQGGMGIVYKAEDTRLRRLVALKFLPAAISADERGRQRFLREAMTASSLDHPNICTVHEVGSTDDGELFIAMTLYEGRTLKELLGKRVLSIAETLDWTAQVAEGLAKAHSKDIIHRDIKPGNLVVTTDGLVKILDFGLARTPTDATLTESGELLGTVPYMSPEQIAGQELDARTDIWSLGVVAYEMLTGQAPFRGPPAAVLLAIQGQAPTPIHMLRRGVPEGVAAVIERAMSKSLEHRYAQVVDLVRDLHACAGFVQKQAGAAETETRSLFRSVASMPPSPAPAPAEPSLAILPFKNLGGDPEGEYFSDGLTDELIHALSAHSALRVVSRTSVFKLKTAAMGLGEIAALLHVDSIVEGSVRILPGRIRILARLVRAADDRQLWSEKYDRGLEDVFSVQDEIASTIAERLTMTLETGSGATEQRLAYRGNVEAYGLYLKGRYFFYRRMLDKSQEFYRAALQLDPNFAPAHAGIASLTAAAGVYGGADPAVVWPQVREAAHHALALDRDLPEAHMAIGFLRTFEDWDWDGAAHAFRKTLELAPSSVDAHLCYIMHLFQRGQFETAWPYVQKAQRLDPLSAMARSSELVGYVYDRQYERAIGLYAELQEIARDALDLHLFHGLALQRLGRFDEALSVLDSIHQATGGGPVTTGFLGACHAEAGQHETARAQLSRLEELAARTYVPPVTRALIHVGLRENDAALAALEEAARLRDALLCYAKVLPGLVPLHEDPRFVSLLARIGLPASLPQQRGNPAP